MAIDGKVNKITGIGIVCRWLILSATIFPLIFSSSVFARIALPRVKQPMSKPVHVTNTPFNPAAPCNNTFITHTLEHFTTTTDGVIRMFEANGSGVAAGDLDNDGDLDLVLGNLDFSNTIQWNEGNLRFRSESFGDPRGNTRALTVVDVDADGWLDIVLTRGTGEVNYWRNQSAEWRVRSMESTTTVNGDSALQTAYSAFVRQTLPGVNRLAYVLNWGDLDQDGDLDLVTATYDAGLLTDRGNDYLLSGSGGVTVYTNADGRFRPSVLAAGSMALALELIDLNDDGRLDILVGNDFEVRDQIWFNTTDSWQPSEPFATTTHSTMSLDRGDIDNNGVDEIFASDMNPYDISARTLAQWLPVMATLEQDREQGDPQRVANVLNVRDGRGVWRNQAPKRGVEASGWSWSARFGDLDNDGWLDLYVVNGMIEERMFKHLPNHELVEENQALHNDGRGNFERMPTWGLNSTYSGRGMILADFDIDGDLDSVVNNLRGPAQLFENRLCGEQSLQVELRQSGVQNRNGIGATLKLYTSIGILRRTVRAAGGYLAGDASRLHFGLPSGVEVEQLEVVWGDGRVSVVVGPALNQRLLVER